MGKRSSTPARTPEAREKQLINLAVDETERRLRNGTISSQLLSILLKLATTRSELELEKLRSDISLQHAKKKEIEEKQSSNDLFLKAIEAFKSYKGDPYEEYEEDDNY